VETVEEGFNILAGAETQSIINAYNIIKDKQINFDSNLYGNGCASKNIVKIVLEKTK